MTTLEIILFFTLCICSVTFLFIIKWYRKVNDNIFSDWKIESNNVKKLAKKGVFDSVLEVNKFNLWFNSNKDLSIYANPGIFLRRDKLCQGYFEDYVRVTTDGFLSFKDFGLHMMRKFMKAVDEDWLIKQEIEDSGDNSKEDDDELYLFRVRDYTTVLVGWRNEERGYFYIQRGDGEMYKYDDDRIVFKKKLL